MPSYSCPSRQEYSPAAYKTHFYYPFCPSGCKKIFVTRDPLVTPLAAAVDTDMATLFGRMDDFAG